MQLSGCNTDSIVEQLSYDLVEVEAGLMNSVTDRLPRGRRRVASNPGATSWSRPGAALALSLLASLWLGLACLYTSATPSATTDDFAARRQSAPPASRPAVAVPTPTTQPTPTPIDEYLVAISGLAPGDRDDDRTIPGNALSAWPFVSVDPEREADQPAPDETPAPAVEPEPHVVADGETFLGIALALSVDPDKLAEVNHVTDRARLALGQRLLIPSPGKEPVRLAMSSRGATLRPRLVWPASGAITTYFGEIGAIWIGGKHTGLDIAAPLGDPVIAAEAGTVLEAGWATGHGYGNYILIDHGSGYQTLYGHLSVIGAKPGQELIRGQLIGQVGSTGVSSGPHLHFELRRDGVASDPLPLLPDR